MTSDIEFVRAVALMALAQHCALTGKYFIDRGQVLRREDEIGRPEIFFQVGDLISIHSPPR